MGNEFPINTTTVTDQELPAIAALGNGGFVVSWQSDQVLDGSSEGIAAQRYDAAGNPLGGEVLVNSVTAANQRAPSIAALTGGGYVVVWESFNVDASGFGIAGQRFDDDGNPLGAEVVFNSFIGGPQQRPAVSALESGGFVVAWGSAGQDNDGNGVFGRQFDADGMPVGGEFRINAFGKGDQEAVDLAGLPGGGFAATWQSSIQDGSGSGVFTQRFGPDVPSNVAPTVALPITDQTASEDLPFVFSVPAGTFIDADAGDALSLAVSLPNGDPLPAWLNFDAQAATFSGTPSNDDVGAIDLTVTATDVAGASVSDAFTLTTTNVNDVPIVTGPIADQVATEDALFVLTLPPGMFADVDAGDSLTLSASLANDDPLPAWLGFNVPARTFSGTPLNGDVGTIDVKVSATDVAGASAATTFTLTAANVNDAPALTSNALTIVEGGSVVLAPSALSAVDVDHDDATLTFAVSSVQHGQFELAGSPGSAVTSFTQQAVMDGAVRFAHDGSELAPTYTVTVSDGDLGDSGVAVVSFSNIDDAPSLHHGAIGSIGFVPGGTAPDVSWSPSIIEGEIVDLNNDGALDAVVTNMAGPYNLRVDKGLLNQGTPLSPGFNSINAPFPVFVAASEHDIATGDLDGDGDVDFFVADSIQGNRVYTNQGDTDGDGIFNILDSGPVIGNALSRSATLGDVDGDGDLDAFVANRQSVNRLWLNAGDVDGDGQVDFVDSGNGFGIADAAHALLFDADDDGDLDAVIADRGGADQLWLNNGDTDADGVVDYSNSAQSLSGAGSEHLLAGDVDGDGDDDLVVLKAAGGNEVWLNRGDTDGDGVVDFADSGLRLGSGSYLLGALGDLDGDGDRDLAVGSQLTAEIFVNDGDADGDGTVEFSRSAVSLGRSPYVALGDVDGDGRLDALITELGQHRVLLNTSGASSQLTYIENDGASIVHGGLTVTDVDSATLTGARVAISGNYQAGADVLLFDDTVNISGGWDSNSGVLSLSGTASVVAYETALRSVRFQNVSQAPEPGPREVAFTVTDASGISTALVRNIEVRPTNDAPFVSEGMPDQDFPEEGIVGFSVPNTAFDDPDGQPLTYSAAGAGGAPLPGWLSFSSSGAFRGMPQPGDAGSYDLEVTASDPLGMTAVDNFVLKLAPPASALSGTEAGEVMQEGAIADGEPGENDTVIYGLGGNDWIRSVRGNDNQYGGFGNASLTGGIGNDHLDGGAGDDSLRGRRGNDRLVGGIGNDVYRIGKRNTGIDSILDVAGDHRIETIATSNGLQLDPVGIDRLVQAMAAFSPPIGAANPLPQETLDVVTPVIAAAWSSA
jgi:hypothetical protein